MFVSTLVSLALIATSVPTPQSVPPITSVSQLPARFQIPSVAFKGTIKKDCYPAIKTVDGVQYYARYSCTIDGTLFEDIWWPLQNLIDGTPLVNMTGYQDTDPKNATMNSNGDLVLR